MACLNIIKDTIPDIPEIQVLRFVQKGSVKPQGRDYWQKVREWESKTGKPFGELVAELRSKLPPDRVWKTLGVSRGFIYYHFGSYMNRISYIEYKYGKKLGEVVRDMRNEGKAMNRIANELGLAVTTLYNHLRESKN